MYTLKKLPASGFLILHVYIDKADRPHIAESYEIGALSHGGTEMIPEYHRCARY